MKTYNLFISHSWKAAQRYHALMTLLEGRGYFNFNDYSVPADDPIEDAPSQRALAEQIKNQIQLSHVVMMLATMHRSKWMKEELEIAETGFTYPKPVLIVRPRGAQKDPQWMFEAGGRTVVNWNTESIVDAIRELAQRGG